MNILKMLEENVDESIQELETQIGELEASIYEAEQKLIQLKGIRRKLNVKQIHIPKEGESIGT